MNWIKRGFETWVEKRIRNALYINEPCGTQIRPKEEIIDSRRAFTLRMQSANGGTIIEISHFDSTQGDFNKELYIVECNKDISDEISKILVQYQLTHI